MQSNAPTLSWPASQIGFRFQGDSLSIILEEENHYRDGNKGKNYFSVFINGDTHSPIIIEAKPGLHSYEIDPARLTNKNEIILFKRNESIANMTRFKGIEIGEMSKILSPPPLPDRRIEFYGDSITAAQEIEAAPQKENKNPKEQNNYLSYGAITARNLDAEYRCIAKSGIGLMKSWFPTTMPQHYNRTDSEGHGPKWDFSQWQPNVVVVNLLQNDSYLLPKETSPPSAEQITDAYKDFIKKLRYEYPDTHIVATLGSMGAVREKEWTDYIQKAIDGLKAEGDENLSVCFLPAQKVFWQHPRAKDHEKNAEVLTAHIRSITQWDSN